MSTNRIPLVVSGLASVPTAFYFWGSASIGFGAICLVILASIGYLFSGNLRKNLYECIKLFVFGAAISELLLLVFWGVRFDYDDGYGLGFALVVGLLQFLCISIIGVMTIYALSFLAKRNV